MKPCPCDLTLPPPERLGARIRELRIDAEMSRNEFARRLGMHGPVVSRIEHGKHLLSYEGLLRIAAVLELDVGTVAIVLDDEWCSGASAQLRKAG